MNKNKQSIGQHNVKSTRTTVWNVKENHSSEVIIKKYTYQFIILVSWFWYPPPHTLLSKDWKKIFLKKNAEKHLIC